MPKKSGKSLVAKDKAMDRKLIPAQLKADIAADKKLLKEKTKK